jgi:hypothetical protein
MTLAAKNTHDTCFRIYTLLELDIVVSEDILCDVYKQWLQEAGRASFALQTMRGDKHLENLASNPPRSSNSA